MSGWGEDHGIVTYTQEGEMNCGMASVAMVINWVKGDKIGTNIIANESRRVGGSQKYVPQFKDDKTLVKVMPDAPTERDDAGSGQTNLVGVLGVYGITAATTKTDRTVGTTRCFSKSTLKGKLNGATMKRPVIVGLVDPPHFVVCGGHSWKMLGSNEYLIADPADGHVYRAAQVSESRLIFSNYDTAVDNLIAVTGVASQSRRVKVM